MTRRILLESVSFRSHFVSCRDCWSCNSGAYLYCSLARFSFPRRRSLPDSMRSREPNNDPDNRLGEKPMESLEIEDIHQSSRRANAYDSDSYHHDAYTDSEEESPIAPYEYRHRKSEHNDTTLMLDPDDARPLVGSSMIGINNTRLTALQTVVKSRACWPVYIGIALVVSLLIAAIAYVPPARRKVTRPDFICPTEPASSLFWTHFTHKVQTWVGPERCRTGRNNDVCSCEDPTQPSIPQSPDSWREGWQRATLRNAALIQDRKHLALDVVLLGDSITEHWLGTGFAEPNNDYQANVPVYQSLFSKEHGAVIEGLALGIIGDRCPNLLARLQNNETVQGLSVKVLWVLVSCVGFNGIFFVATQCADALKFLYCNRSGPTTTRAAFVVWIVSWRATWPLSESCDSKSPRPPL